MHHTDFTTVTLVYRRHIPACRLLCPAGAQVGEICEEATKEPRSDRTSVVALVVASVVWEWAVASVVWEWAVASVVWEWAVLSAGTY